MGYTILTGIWEEVDDEITAAMRKHGPQSMRQRPTETAALALAEEVGEVCQAVIDRADGRSTRDGGTANIRHELIQVAAGAIAMIQKLDEEKLTAPLVPGPICPHCATPLNEVYDEVDIGVGVQRGPTTGYDCPNCGYQR